MNAVRTKASRIGQWISNLQRFHLRVTKDLMEISVNTPSLHLAYSIQLTFQAYIRASERSGDSVKERDGQRVCYTLAPGTLEAPKSHSGERDPSGDGGDWDSRCVRKIATASAGIELDPRWI